MPTCNLSNGIGVSDPTLQERSKLSLEIHDMGRDPKPSGGQGRCSPITNKQIAFVCLTYLAPPFSISPAAASLPRLARGFRRVVAVGQTERA